LKFNALEIVSMKIVRFRGAGKLAVAAGLVALMLGSSRHARADMVTFEGVGTPTNSTFPVDVTAVFSHVGSDLHIDLYNNKSGADPLQVLTGLFWNVTGTAPTGTSLSTAVVGAGSYLWTSDGSGVAGANLKSGFTTPSGGGNGWKYGAPPGADDGTTFQFGLGASGLTGAFGGLGNDDWGIIGPNSNLLASNLHNKLPLVMSTSSDPSMASFVIANFNVDASRIGDVRFVFGSAGDVHIAGAPHQGGLSAVPEPSSLVMTAGGLGILAMGYRRRLRAGAARTPSEVTPSS
jgi:hypothetical protein